MVVGGGKALGCPWVERGGGWCNGVGGCMNRPADREAREREREVGGGGGEWCGVANGDRTAVRYGRGNQRGRRWACMHFFSAPRVLIPESFKMAAGAESANDCLNR